MHLPGHVPIGGHCSEGLASGSASGTLLRLPRDFVEDALEDVLDARPLDYLSGEAELREVLGVTVYEAEVGALRWALLWDVYLKWIGDSEWRWRAYAAFARGISLNGRLAHTGSADGLHFLRIGTGLTMRAGEMISSSSDVFRCDALQQLRELFLPRTDIDVETDAEALNACLVFQPKKGARFEALAAAFKSVIRGFSFSQRAAFLQFATSLRALPRCCNAVSKSADADAGGGTGTPPPPLTLTVRWLPGLSAMHLPVAHTCGLTLDMPCYDSDATLKNQLEKAVALAASARRTDTGGMGGGGGLPFAIS